MRANELQAANFAAQLDAELTSNVNFLMKLEKSSIFTYCLKSDNSQGDIDHYDLEQLRQQLKLAVSSNTLDLFICFNHHGIIVSSANGTGESYLYYRSYYASGSQSYKDWQNLLNADVFSRCSVVYYGGERCLAVTRTLPTDRTMNSHAVAVSVLRPSALTAFKDVSATAQGAVAIYDDSGNLLIASDESMAPQSLPAISEKNHYTAVDVNGDAYYFSLRDSSLSGCRYVSIVAADIFAEKTARLLRLQWIIMGAVVVLGFAVAYLLTRRNVRPIEETVHAVVDASQIAWHQNAENEFDYLKNAMTSIVSDKVLLQNTLDKRSHSIQQNFLYEALYGALRSEKDVCSRFSDYHIPTVSHRFSVLLTDVVVSESDRFLEEAKKAAYKLGFLINTVYVAYPRMAVLLNLPADASETVATDFAHTLHTLFPASIAISDSAEGGEGLTQAFRQAAHLLEYRIVYGDEVLLTSRLLTDLPPARSHARYFEQAENLLLETLRSKEAPSKELEQKLMACYSENGIRTPIGARNFMHDTSFLMAEALSSRLSTASVQALWEKNPTVLSAETLPDFCREMIRCLASAQQMLSQDDDTDNLIRRIDEYLQAHFRDSALCLSALEPVFSVGGGYLSEKYKDARGITIPERITQLRVEEICRMLQETDLSLEAIASDVGLGNANTLIRIFKKAMAVTPGAYRKSR